jgi:cobalt-zinc-cadmium efflux system outer membrane protein
MRRTLFLPLVTILVCGHGLFFSTNQLHAQQQLPAPQVGLAFAPLEELPEPKSQADPISLAGLWTLALANNPVLKETAAAVDAARGELIQAGQYPNPRLRYKEDLLGTPQERAGDISLEASQEVLTGGKRRLDIAIAARTTDIAALTARAREFELLTHLRRSYADYLGWQDTEQVNAQVVASLVQGVDITRRQVEQAKIRPRTDLVRLSAVLEEARLNHERAAVRRHAAWIELAAQVGVPELPMPDFMASADEAVPRWPMAAAMERILAVNTAVRQAALETDRARVQIERARADAIPNVVVSGGYSFNLPEREQGALIAVEAQLPLWDRKQGRIREAQANWARAQAAERSVVLRLTREAAAAFGRFEAARAQVAGLTSTVLPRLVESADLVRKGYQAVGGQVTFADVLLAEQTLNDARLRLAEARRELRLAVADLQGLMQLKIDEPVPALRDVAGPAPCLP